MKISSALEIKHANIRAILGCKLKIEQLEL